MDESKLLAILDKLTPTSFLDPNESDVVKNTLMLCDDAKMNEDHSASIKLLYSNTISYEAIDADVIKQRFSDGIHRMEEKEDTTDVTHLAYWKPSSTKVNFPIENALNHDPNSYWQSDGKQPHRMDIYFSKFMNLKYLAFYLSQFQDESYTPREIKIYYGNGPNDCRLFVHVIIQSVNGWFLIPTDTARCVDMEVTVTELNCRFLRFEFPFNFEHGKDTHLRGMKILAKANKKSVEMDGWLKTSTMENNFLNAFPLK
ncbi:anaphase promoting complex subunit DOC1 NDAI_0I03220 [Naumovozyma dairenensis CBS 421]|uniref:DOC domain-containing protein n=1 Tax=Naumovozyma dairenensis (strain ATCC 10597 / BCRC 20456 / CBS 421 / NBRC 0211 / NRRL Y-12639) TaxID=1071378 RepID=G0WGH9_NAUDC|nr:hypothetical protein NDAI_0I03220 [Naumovozyma dairenensis CBS 421]CCD26890.1 hypothetical protein NDAI_0I03220 [Naumovozyma dairenensis CBS 421]